jgi:hypothetical protein
MTRRAEGRDGHTAARITLLAVLVLAACGRAGRDGSDSTGGSAAAMPAAGATTAALPTAGASAGATTDATVGAAPAGVSTADSIAGRRPSPLPQPGGSVAPMRGASGGSASRAPSTGRPAVRPASNAGGAAGAGGAEQGSDTLRGTIAVVGSTPMTEVTIRPRGERPVTLVGGRVEQLRRLSGADVWVVGTRTAEGTLDVSRFAVRSVDGVAATDGMLTSDAGQLYLVTPDGHRHLVISPPPALREQVGARVWISGELAGTVVQFGVIQPRRG